MVDGYTLHDEVGRGAVSTVHRAEDRLHPGRIVAVKRIPGGRQHHDAVRREAAALERLAHPSIVRVLDVVEDGSGSALITPFLPGGSLADRIARGAMTAAAVADLGARIGDALAAAHDADVVHRDVTPANILYDAEEQPLLADFGAALLEREGDGWLVGSATYLDPALVEGTATPGPSSDQYGLGAVLYEALAGVPPYAAPTIDATLRAAQRGVHLPLAQLAPDAPDALTDTIERALSRSPQDRFDTVRELASRLQEAGTRLLLEGTSDPSTPTWRAPASPGPSRARSRRDRDAAAPLRTPPPDAADTGRTDDDAAAGGPPPPPPGATSTPSPTSAPPGVIAPAVGGPRRTSANPNVTTRFGPAPTPAEPAPAPDTSRRWPVLILGAVAVLLVPVGIVVAFVVGQDDDGALTEATGLPSEGTFDRDELPVCDDAPEPPDAPEITPADTDGRGCTVPIGWDPQERILTVPDTDGAPQRSQLGQADDELVIGAWGCDDRDAPGLYRPETGQVFAFGGFAGPDEQLDSRPAEDSGVTDGTPRVVRDDEGCDRVEVEPG